MAYLGEQTRCEASIRFKAHVCLTTSFQIRPLFFFRSHSRDRRSPCGPHRCNRIVQRLCTSPSTNSASPSHNSLALHRATCQRGCKSVSINSYEAMFLQLLLAFLLDSGIYHYTFTCSSNQGIFECVQCFRCRFEKRPLYKMTFYYR